MSERECEPNLGCATTEELLNELLARAQVGGYADYRTIDSGSETGKVIELNDEGWPLPPDLSDSLE